MHNDCPWILLLRRESNTFCVDNVILEKIWFSIDNGNWTKWSAIRAEIICMISNSNECTAWVWFEITSMISDQNCMTRGSITTLLHPFHFEITQIQDLVSSNILLMQQWAGLKLNSSMFWGEKVRVLETKVAKFAVQYSLSFISCNLISYFKQALKSDWLFCLKCSLLISWKKDAI